MRRFIQKSLDCFFLIRPMLMPPVWTIALLGFGRAQQATGGQEWGVTLVPIALFSLLTGGVYVQNQLYDVEGDRANGKLFLLAEGLVSVIEARWITAILFFVAVVGGWFYSFWLGVILSLSFVLGIAYNVAPFRFKDRPYAGYLYNALIYGVVVFLVGWGAVAPITSEALLATIPYFFGVGAIYLNTTLPDIPGDRANGKMTLGVIWGFKGTAYAACVLLATGTVAGALLKDDYFMIPGAVILPFFGYMAWKGSMEAVALATKLGVLALAVPAMILCPPYFLLLTLLFFGSKPYYRNRFGIRYPSFRYQR